MPGTSSSAENCQSPDVAAEALLPVMNEVKANTGSTSSKDAVLDGAPGLAPSQQISAVPQAQNQRNLFVVQWVINVVLHRASMKSPSTLSSKCCSA